MTSLAAHKTQDKLRMSHHVCHSCFVIYSFATFIVVERESKAKHLQTVAGVEPTAYWLATLLWDIINYMFPATITGTSRVQ